MKKTFSRTNRPASYQAVPPCRCSAEPGKSTQVSGPVEYRFVDVWGDDPSLTPCAMIHHETPAPEAQVVVASAPRRTWMRRLLGWFTNSDTIVADESIDYLPGSLPASTLSLLRQDELQEPPDS